MTWGRASLLGQVARAVLVPLFVWLLAVQSIALPLARARLVEALGSDSALSVLCASSLPVPGDGERDDSPRKVQDFGCCILACATMLAQPAVVPSEVIPAVPSRAGLAFRPFLLSQGRAPPPLTARPLQPRAPPSLA